MSKSSDGPANHVSATSLLGAAGEHYVMCQLLRRGMIAALAPAGVPNCDIVVTDGIGDRLCAIQVKTRQDKGTDGGWHMGKKHESIVTPTLFYVFLDFGKDVNALPACFIVPSTVVAQVVRETHQVWLDTPGKKGQQRADTDFRRLVPDYRKLGLDVPYGPGWLEEYRDKWNCLDAGRVSRPESEYGPSFPSVGVAG